MNSDDYIKNVLKTESADYEKIKQRIATRRNVRLLHGVMGISTESGELMDSVKKFLFYGKNIDVVNVVEELGDLLWYMALICDELKISLDDVMRINIDKLKSRYGEKFDESLALNRNLDVERQVLDKSEIAEDLED
jgi:NTP pyrophosphatase (non-canonical NTP hydrolase)